MLTVSNTVLQRIWQPDTYFENSKRSTFHDVTVPNKMLRIHQNGKVEYNARFVKMLSGMSPFLHWISMLVFSGIFTSCWCPIARTIHYDQHLRSTSSLFGAQGRAKIGARNTTGSSISFFFGTRPGMHFWLNWSTVPAIASDEIDEGCHIAQTV